MKVKDIMTRDVTAVTESANLRDVARVLSNHGISGVPVVDDEHRVVGFITDADLLKSSLPSYLSMLSDTSFIPDFGQFVKRLRENAARSVADFMNKEVVCVEEDDSDTYVADIMVRKGVKRVPVLRNSRLVGVVTRVDLFKSLMEKESDEDMQEQ